LKPASKNQEASSVELIEGAVVSGDMEPHPNSSNLGEQESLFLPEEGPDIAIDGRLTGGPGLPPILPIARSGVDRSNLYE
jgi:hypothetical protein